MNSKSSGLSSPIQSSESYSSSSSNQRRDEILNDLHGKIKNLLIAKKKNMKLQSKLSDFKKLCNKLERYKVRLINLQKQVAALLEAADLPEDTTLDTFQNKLKYLIEQEKLIKRLKKTLEVDDDHDLLTKIKLLKYK